MSPTVGEQLKEERVKRGLTLEQASQATHIRKAYLEALENDQRSLLPSNVQGRGFMRLYADWLSLPVAPLLNAWDGIQTAPQEINPPEPVNEPASKLVTREEESPTPPQPEDPLFTEANAAPIPVEISEAAPPQTSESESRAIFAEIGQRLRQQRESLGISLTEVERYTRLRQHYLQAIEDGRIDRLPSPVQGRGMLSNYAAFLDLDEDKILLRFAEGLQQRRIERLPVVVPQPVSNKKRQARPASALRRFLTPDLIFGLVVVTAILFFAIRTALSISSMRAAEAQPTTRAISEVLLTPASSLSTEAVTPDATPMGTPQPTLPAAATLVSGSAAGPDSALPAVINPTIEPINNDPLQVYIIARQRAYLRIMIDNQEKFNGRVVPGNAYAFSALKSINLVSGNAAALQIFFNQNDLGTLGLEGQVINLVFDAQGMLTATPLPTPTRTATPLVTETPSPTPTITGTILVTPTGTVKAP